MCRNRPGRRWSARRRTRRALASLERADVDAVVPDIDLDGERAGPIADRPAARGVPFVSLTGDGPDGIEGDHAARPTSGKPLKPLAPFRTSTEPRAPPP